MNEEKARLLEENDWWLDNAETGIPLVGSMNFLIFKVIYSSAITNYVVNTGIFFFADR